MTGFFARVDHAARCLELCSADRLGAMLNFSDEEREARRDPDDMKRALRRIRRAVTTAVEWEVESAFAGGGNPDLIDWKRERAAKARATLDRILIEELTNANR